MPINLIYFMFSKNNSKVIYHHNNFISHIAWINLYWCLGPSKFTGIASSKYYLIFIDYYIKYIWFYSMFHKANASSIFPLFKILLKRYLISKINLFAQTTGEYVALKFYFSIHGIIYYTSVIHKPQQNCVVSIIIAT